MEILEVTCAHADFLSDESRRIGTAELIAFPKTEAEVVELIATDVSSCITIQGALTGITGGAVPQGGTIINLSRMNQLGECCNHRVMVQPGARLDEIRAMVESHGLFFPPDPTETTASIGGMVACNASGARTFRYGPTRRWIQSLRVILADGDAVKLERGKQCATGRVFSLETESGRIISGTLPDYQMPVVKNAAGYFVRDDMELIDLFIGAEGTLGIVTEIELNLLPMPASFVALCAFMPTQSAALQLVEELRPLDPAAIEFFDRRALDLIRKGGAGLAKSLPQTSNQSVAIYVEFIDNDLAMQAAEQMIALGADEDKIWFADEPADLEQLKEFRHATPEAVNGLIAERKRGCPELMKLGTDMSVPDKQLEATLAMYTGDLEAAGLEFVIFGHIGNSHLHVNILPRNLTDYSKGQALYEKWATRIVALGGSVAAEHGIGKNKTDFLKMMVGASGINQMRKLKTTFDPQWHLNSGNLFSVGSSEKE